MKRNPNYVEPINDQPINDQPQPDTSSHLFDGRHKAYQRIHPQPSNYNLEDTCFPAEPIETEVERMLNNGEPIGAASPQIYTDRLEGVLPEHDIRTDHFELAMDATELAAKNQLARREEFHKKLKEDNKKGASGTAGEPPKTP